MMLSRTREGRLGAVVLALLPTLALPQDLPTVWRAAEQNDRTLAVARAEHAAAQTRREQAAALWRPNVLLGLAGGLGASDTRMKGAQFSAPGLGTSDGVNFATSVYGGLATRASVTAQQPLVNPVRQAARAELELNADMADTAWRAARSELVLRTAECYVALAVAQEQLRVAERQAQSVARATTEAHDRFQLGESPITDAHEADAALAAVRARVEATRLQRDLARQTLADSTGLIEPAARLPDAVSAPGESLQAWMVTAQDANPQVQLASQGVAMAEQQWRKRRAGDSASVDLVSQAGFDRLGGRGDFGSASNRSATAMVGVQVTWPLYDGGMSRAQSSEGARLIEKAQAQLEQAREQVAEQVRAAWLGWQASQARIAALQDGLKASAARLDATRLGRSVGDRTLMDVLNAENDLAQAALVLDEARADQLRQRLRLAVLADRLDDGLQAQLSAAPSPSTSPTAAATSTKPGPDAGAPAPRSTLPARGDRQ